MKWYGRFLSDRSDSIASTRSDQVGRYSPDGRQIAFVSDRTGQSEIWIANADGTNQVQLTSLENAGAPSWSPDGQKIVFSSPISGSPQVYAISLGGGKPLQITSAAPGCTIPRYSRDGKWIYCASRRTGRFEIWKISSAGGEPVQVTRNGGHTADESPDGAWLYFTRDDSSRSLLMKIPSGAVPRGRSYPRSRVAHSRRAPRVCTSSSTIPPAPPQSVS